MARQRPQCLRRIVRGFHISVSANEQRRRGTERDEIRDQVGEKHPDVYVVSGVAEFLIGGIRRRVRMCHRQLLLHFLACLPEIHIRRKPRSDNRHQHRHIAAIELQRGVDRCPQHLPPIRLGEKGRANIREQCDCEPTEYLVQQFVTTPALHNKNDDGESNRDAGHRNREKQSKASCDGPDVGTRLKDVGRYHGAQHRI